MRNKISIVFLVSAFLSALLAPNAEAVVDTNPPVCSFDAKSGRGTATDNRLGEDKNDNGKLDPGEDLNSNEQLDRDTGWTWIPLNRARASSATPVTVPDPTIAGTGRIGAVDGGAAGPVLNRGPRAPNFCLAQVDIPPNARPTASSVDAC